MALAGCAITMDLDPELFGEITSAAAFSSTGDVSAIGAIQGLHVEINSSSPALGFGRTPDLPLATVTALVRSDAPIGPRKGAATATATCSPSVTLGDFSVSGSLSIRSITPGTGVHGFLKILGTGFTKETAIEIPAAVITKTELISDTEIDVTLAGPIEITGRRVRARNAQGESVDFFPSASGSFTISGYRVQLTQPLRSYRETLSATLRSGVHIADLVIQNPNSLPVDVTLRTLTFYLVPRQSETISLGPGASLARNGIDLNNSPSDVVHVEGSAPIRVNRVNEVDAGCRPQGPNCLNTFALNPASPRYRQAGAGFISDFKTVAGMNPEPRIVSIDDTRGTPYDFRVSTTAYSGGNWLSISPTSGTTCGGGGACNTTQFKLAVNVAGLAPGTYTGSVQVTPVPADGIPASTFVRLDVTGPNPLPVVITFYGLERNGVTASVAPGESSTGTISVDVGPANVPIQALATTEDGAQWLTITTSNGVDHNYSIDTSRLSLGVHRGSLKFTAGGSTAILPVVATVAYPAYQAPPAIGAVVNAASQREGAVAPGEIVTIFGVEVGPLARYGAATDSTGHGSSPLGGARVLFDGVPAPLYYAGPSQLNAVVPASLAGPLTRVAVEYAGLRSEDWTIPVARSAPAIFTLSGTGGSV